MSTAHAAPIAAFRSDTYVMQGDPAESRLSTYHLILAGTHACNLRCRHCYLPDHDTGALAETTALGLVDQWSRIVERECGGKNGIFHVKGGEPLVIPYFRRLMNRVLTAGNLHLMLTTNGTLGSARLFEDFAAYNRTASGELTVIVSLDGAVQASHELLRGHNQFRKTIDFVQNLAQRGIRTFLNCVLHSANFREAEEYLDLAARLGVRQVNFLPLVPKGFGQDIQHQQVPHLQLHRHLDSIYHRVASPIRDLMAGSLSHIMDRAHRGVSPAHECTAGYRGLFYIAPDGNAYTCPNITNPSFSLGNVNVETLTDIMGRLGSLRAQIKAHSEYGDGYICAGERLLYEGRRDDANFNNLVQLQSHCDEQLAATKTQSNTERAYCVSRNF